MLIMSTLHKLPNRLMKIGSAPGHSYSVEHDHELSFLVALESLRYARKRANRMLQHAVSLLMLLDEGGGAPHEGVARVASVAVAVILVGGSVGHNLKCGSRTRELEWFRRKCFIKDQIEVKSLKVKESRAERRILMRETDEVTCEEKGLEPCRRKREQG